MSLDFQNVSTLNSLIKREERSKNDILKLLLAFGADIWLVVTI